MVGRSLSIRRSTMKQFMLGTHFSREHSEQSRLAGALALLTKAALPYLEFH